MPAKKQSRNLSQINWYKTIIVAVTTIFTLVILLFIHHNFFGDKNISASHVSSSSMPSNDATHNQSAKMTAVTLSTNLPDDTKSSQSNPKTKLSQLKDKQNKKLRFSGALQVATPQNTFDSLNDSISAFPSFSSLIKCSKDVSKKYSSLSSFKSSIDQDKKWCLSTKNAHHVVVGRSWGSLSKNQQKEWEDRHCNEFAQLGEILSCDKKWGWKWFQTWKQAAYEVLSSHSHVKCFVDNIRTSTYCEMEDIMVDFSKMSQRGATRNFASGFFTLFGALDHSQRSFLPLYPGIKTDLNTKPVCPNVINETVYLLSNDDIFNLGHYINDVMNVWMLIILTEGGLSPDQTAFKTPKILLNIDGLRAGGPAGGPPHRLMLAHAPDSHGPYSHAYYHTWFNNNVKKAIDFQDQKVCFKRLVTIPSPGVPWFWNDWGRINDCATVGPSPLYQSFSYFLRKHVHTGLNLPLSPPPTDKINIVIEVREINKAKQNNHSRARYILNRQQLIEELSKIPGVIVTAQNFAALPFTQQIQLAHRTSILISMHGAGTTHIFHMAVGSKNCCGLLELFPDNTVEFSTAHGYENLAKMLGFHHRRYVPPLGSTRHEGTKIEVEKVVALAKELVNNVSKKPTCMHDAKDY